MEAALDGVYGHAEHLGDFGWFHVLLIAKHNDGALGFGEGGDKFFERLGEEGVAGAVLRGGFGDGVEGDGAGAAEAAAGFVDGAVSGDTAEPIDQMRRGLDGCEIAVQVQEGFLGEVFGFRGIVKEMIRHTEHHGLMLADEVGEGVPVAVDGRGERLSDLVFGHQHSIQ